MLDKYYQKLLTEKYYEIGISIHGTISAHIKLNTKILNEYLVILCINLISKISS